MKFIKFALIFLIIHSTTLSQETTLHKYKLIVQDINGNSMDKKRIKYSIMSDLFNSQKIIKHDEAITSATGEVVITAEIPIEWEYSGYEDVDELFEGQPQFSSMLLYEIKDSTHFPITGQLKSYRGGVATYSSSYYDSKQEWYDLTMKEYQVDILILASKEDYFVKNFSNSKDGKKYKKNLERLLDYLIINKIPETISLKYSSIYFEQFRKQSFLSLSFKSNSVYNSNRLSEYDIVKKLLDENVYSLIKNVNDFISFEKNKIGLCINIDFYSESFLEKNSSPKKYQVNFYFGDDVLKKYLIKDISRQELLSKSTVLLNEDKIDIK